LDRNPVTIIRNSRRNSLVSSASPQFRSNYKVIGKK
jgi:hypothetical protein